MVVGKGNKDSLLSDDEVYEISSKALAKIDLTGKRVLIISPDHTRTAPMPLFFRLFYDLIGSRAQKMDYLIALGTHPAISEDKINELFGISAEERKGKYGTIGLFNHTWDNPETLKTVGTITADEIAEISGGLMREEVSVDINKIIFAYDYLIICGPVFPHEVVGFSGGNKYFFPGISGPEVLNFFHWLGAVITNPVINGTKDTPVRRVVDKAASFLHIPKLCFAMVVTDQGLHGLYIGSPEEAYTRAADLSAKVHIIYKDRSFERVLSMSPEMYDDIWTAGKCMYKLEPVVADGGELIIYAPHITEVSYTHGKYLDKIGYHTRDYFLKQMDRFSDIPRCVLAHSTHVKGIGTYEGGVEKPRVNVVLAMSIPEERCKRINLGYKNPEEINPAEWEGREDEGVLLVPKAGETLYRLRK
jgi:nickel-dependent lactate racemase